MSRKSFWPVVATILSLALVHGRAVQSEEVPCPESLVERAAQRLQQSETAPQGPMLRKVTLTEEFDGTGRLRERKEKLYETSADSGRPELQIVWINGRALSESEVRQYRARESQERQKMGSAASSREQLLNSDVLARYQFRHAGREVVAGRESFLLEFEPRAGYPARQWMDRLLNQLNGKVWIDAEESEISRLEVQLQGELTLWGGLLGALRKLQYRLERSRLEDGTWIDALSVGDFQGRRLFDPTRIKTRSEVAPMVQLGANAR